MCRDLAKTERDFNEALFCSLARSLKDNPVGELQELVTCMGWRKPEYEALEESGPPHNRRFVISVSVDKYKEQGT